MKQVLIDLHCHTQEHSFDGRVPAVQIVRALVEAGYAGLIFTDHNYCWPEEELASLRKEAGAPHDFVLLSGQEVRVSSDGHLIGDLLVYGPTEHIEDGADAHELIHRADAERGFCIAAHLGAHMVGMGEHVRDYPVLAAEVWNGRYGGRVAAISESLADQFGIPKVGGSDTHQPNDIGGGGTLVPEVPHSLVHLRRLIEEGKCEPWRPSASRRLMRWLKSEAD